jgi:beta-ureidopropionase / N-carbamoyl-L-amino-acid hydrolase
MSITLDQLNRASASDALKMLEGIYEHSPWVAQAIIMHRPFRSLPALKHALLTAVDNADRDAQLALIRSHPELAGKAMISKSLTAESANEQSKAGLTQCTPEEFARLQELNANYNAKFGWPFILAVRGPRGDGPSKNEIIATLERRLAGQPAFEFDECLRNIHRIAEIRLNDLFGAIPVRGNLIWDWAQTLALHSDPGFAEHGQLTVTYLTQAHQACAAQLCAWMREYGFDSVAIDAVGNVVGVYKGTGAQTKALMTGSHYDTVRNGGKYDGRLGILIPMACVRTLAQSGKRLPFDIEVIGFAEEEGQRYKATFLASSALTGHFNLAWLDQTDAHGVPMREAMRAAGLPATPQAIEAVKRDPAKYHGFIEVHIEQGPVLNEMNLPLGVVTSINGSVRYLGSIIGTACHAGTTPMDRRSDAVAAFAELALYVEKRAKQDAGCVGTVGMLNVPGGSINVVPGRCDFSLDLRAPTNSQRDALAKDVLNELSAVCQRRGTRHTIEETLRASAAPSHPQWQKRWENAVEALGLPVHTMPSGAGHDAMKLYEIMPQAMLFVRGLNSGISHNPLESSTNDDIELAVQAFEHVLHQLAQHTVPS